MCCCCRTEFNQFNNFELKSYGNRAIDNTFC